MLSALLMLLAVSPSLADKPEIDVKETDKDIQIETDCLKATINKKGYVSGTAAGSFVDKKTGAKDLGYGLHIMDFLMAPGWRDDGYSRDPMVHGDLPKHYVEGPQICTKAKELKPEIIKGDKFVAIRQRFTFTEPGKGYKAGSTWEQILVFQPGVRWFLSSESIKSANDVDNLFYRIDMPGHVKHKGDDVFRQAYLSYRAQPISAREFNDNFPPDKIFFYQRRDDRIPTRMIRAYQVRMDRKPGPWLAGMTLDPAAVSQAWCHERGYVCFIQELHGRKVKAGETFGAAYVVGWFDSITDMNRLYDRYKGKRRIILDKDKFRLE